MVKMENRKLLSKNLLQMKFMKRTKEKQDEEAENEERNKLFKSEISDAMRIHGNQFMTEPSCALIEDLLFGRMAFRGMNPEIERMMEETKMKEEAKEQVKNEKEVQDSEMAEYFRKQSINRTIGRKFASKCDNATLKSSTSHSEDIDESRKKKRKFLKPRD